MERKVFPLIFSVLSVALVTAACSPPSINPSINLQLPPLGQGEDSYAVTLEASATSGPAPLEVIFTATDAESATYAWFINDRKLQSTQDTLKRAFKAPGTYEVTVTATNTAGEVDTDSVVVTVLEEGETATPTSI